MSTTHKERNAERSVDPTLRILKPAIPGLSLGVVLQIIGSALSAMTFLALASIARHLLPGGDGEAMGPLIVFLTALGLSTLFGALALLVTHVVDVNLQADLRLRLANKLSRLPLGWFDDRSSGRVRQLIQNDVDSLHQLVAHTVVELVAGILNPLVSVIVCFILDWRLGLVSLVPAVLYAVVFSALASGNNKDIMDRIHEGLAGVSDAIVEYVNGIAVLKIFSRSEQGSKRFSRRSEGFLKNFEAMVGPQMKAQAIAVVFLSAATAGAIEVAFGLWFVHAGWSEPADLLVITVIAMLLPAAMQTVAVSNQARTQAADAAARICEIFDVPELTQPAEPVAPLDTTIELDQVTFGYASDHPAVREVTATLPAGGVTALVGPSGSGKSTLAALIARFRDPDAGSIRIGGADVRDIGAEELRNTVGTVFQDCQLLNISVRDNIRLSAPDASDRQVEEAARAANIHERIQELPRGYDSVIGKDARLSGGESQRVGIARALLADTPILILDEATSATDPESETAIQEGLNRLTAGRTVVVIAHRLSTIAEADQILVLDGGAVVERGTHAELIDHDGLYKQMWDDMEQED